MGCFYSCSFNLLSTASLHLTAASEPSACLCSKGILDALWLTCAVCKAAPSKGHGQGTRATVSTAVAQWRTRWRLPSHTRRRTRWRREAPARHPVAPPHHVTACRWRKPHAEVGQSVGSCGEFLAWGCPQCACREADRVAARGQGGEEHFSVASA